MGRGYIRPPYTRVLDSVAAENLDRRFQRDWIPFFNAQRKAMMSAWDFYRVPDEQKRE